MKRTIVVLVAALSIGLSGCQPGAEADVASDQGTPTNQMSTKGGTVVPDTPEGKTSEAAKTPEAPVAAEVKPSAASAVEVKARIAGKVYPRDEETGYPELYHLELTLPPTIDVPAPWSGSFDLATFETDTGRNLRPSEGFRSGMGNSIRWDELRWDESKRTIRIPFQGEAVDMASSTISLRGSFHLVYPQATKTVVVDEVLTKDRFEIGTFGQCQLVIRRPGKDGLWLMAPKGHGINVKDVRVKALDGSIVPHGLLAEVRAEVGVINLIITPKEGEFSTGISLEIDVAENVKIVPLTFSIDHVSIESLGK